VGSHQAVVGGWKVLGEIIGKVFWAGSPVDDELSLLYTVFDPVETHVDGFGATLANAIIGDAGGARVIGLNGGGWLRVAHVV
jgi:hypothetical protein